MSSEALPSGQVVVDKGSLVGPISLAAGSKLHVLCNSTHFCIITCACVIELSFFIHSLCIYLHNLIHHTSLSSWMGTRP